MVMLLRRLGYEIAVAPHGLAALQLLERESRRGPHFEIECIIMVRQTGEERTPAPPRSGTQGGDGL